MEKVVYLKSYDGFVKAKLQGSLFTEQTLNHDKMYEMNFNGTHEAALAHLLQSGHWKIDDKQYFWGIFYTKYKNK